MVQQPGLGLGKTGGLSCSPLHGRSRLQTLAKVLKTCFSLCLSFSKPDSSGTESLVGLGGEAELAGLRKPPGETGWMKGKEGRWMGKTVATTPDDPKASFDLGRSIWVSQVDVRGDTCVCVSHGEPASVRLLVLVCIWCLGHSSSFLFVCR